MQKKQLAMRTALTIGVICGTVGYALPAAAGQNIKVELVIASDPTYAGSKAQAVKWCKLGINDYDVAKGSTIKLLSGNGDTVGLGRLSTVNAIKSSGDYYCTYKGTVNADYSKYYSVEIDGRGGPDYTYNEIKNDGWTITLSL